MILITRIYKMSHSASLKLECLHQLGKTDDGSQQIRDPSRDSTLNTICASDFSVEERSTDVYHTKEDTENGFTPVKSKKKEKRKNKTTPPTTTLSEGDNWILSSEFDYLDDVSADISQMKYLAWHPEKHRRNVKETKRRKYKISSIPHGLEDDYPALHDGPNGHDSSLFCNPSLKCENSRDPLESKDLPPRPHNPSSTPPPEDERNELVRIAHETEAQKVTDDSDLMKLLSSVSDMANGDSDPAVNDWVSHLENLIVLGYQISRSESFTDVFVAVVGYIKMNTQQSVVKQILTLIDELTTACPSDDVTPHAWTGNQVLQKWELFKNHSIFTKISFLITAAMSLSVCSIKQVEWSPFGLKLVALEAAKQQLSAVDVIDALISTFTWIAETGYRVFQEKSLMPLLYSDQKMNQFNEKCDWVMAHAESVLAGNGEDVSLFEYKVDEVLRDVCEFKKTTKDGPTSLWLQKRYSELVHIKHSIVAKHRNTSIRFAPFGVGITGPSGVGKSTLAKLVMKIALHAMGFEPDPKRIITKDMFDAYDSTMTSDILGMYMDDVGCGKAEFAKVAFTDVIIKFFNNMAAQAVKAELNAKGVVFIGFKVGVLTSNFEDYNVRLFAAKPEAILRRFYHVRTRIKPHFRKPGSISLNSLHPELAESDLTKDVWELDIQECHIYETKDGHESYCFRTIVRDIEGKPTKCENLNLSQFVDAIIGLAQDHKKAQDAVIRRSEDFDKMAMCSTCFRPAPMCRCVQKVEPHGIETLVDVATEAAQRAVKSYFDQWFSPVRFLNSLVGYRPVKSLATRQLACEMKHILNEGATPFLVAITPEWLFQTTVFKRSIALWQRSAATYDLRNHVRFGIIFGSGLTTLGLLMRNKRMTGVAIGGSWFGSMFYWSQHRARMKFYEEEYLRRRDALPTFAKFARDSHVVKGAFVASTLVVGLKLFRLWNKMRLEKNIVPAGDMTDIDDQPSWFGFMMKKMGLQPVVTTPTMKFATSEQLVSAFKRNNLFWAEFTRADGSKIRSNIFFPRKNVAWFPYHIFFPNSDLSAEPTDTLSITVTRHKDRAGGIFTFKCDFSSIVISEDHDLVCAFVPRCPDFKNRLEMLPVTQPKGSSFCKFIVQFNDDKIEERVAVEYGDVAHKYKKFYGGSYTTQYARNGACMGMLISESKDPFIAGFHIGGNAECNYGVMQTITKSEAEAMIEELAGKPGVLLSSEADEIPDQQMGHNVLDSTEVHPHCMAAKLDAKAYVDVLGSTHLRAQSKSSVATSLISESVSKIFGVPNTWGPPNLRPNWKAYNATLEHIVNPADEFFPSELERARQDWLSPLFPLMREHCTKEDFRPLTDHEMVCGIDGKRFIDALVMSTSMGFPVYGAKKPFFKETVHDGIIHREPNEVVRAEMRRLMKCWSEGKRGYPVMSATLKDEPTEIGKEKVRVFQACPVSLSLYIRKYFLPVARFLSLHPLISESAVGVNAFSPQWETLMAHATKFAQDNKVIAWDYSKYDVRMTSQVTTAVFLSFIELAEVGGYDENSIRIMKMMVADIVHPLLDYNGTLVMAYNMNTSGNNVTVNINSTAGSFYVRMGFFHVYPEVQDFRSKVAAMTYGDDFKGSVHPDYRKFNFLSYKAYLAKYGIKITLPDKGDHEVDFMDEKHADFLKRHSNYIPEIAFSLGMLDEMSIFKSLHCNLLSKSQTPLEVSVSCIEGAMHEWFAHGKKVYELRQSQMREVCSAHELRIPAVEFSFDERVQHWLSKYKSS